MASYAVNSSQQDSQQERSILSKYNTEPYIFVLLIGFLLAGICTNILVLVALIRSSKLKKNAYVVLVLLLCLSDIVLCINSLGFYLYYIFKIGNNRVNSTECHVTLHFLMSGIASSLGQTLLICINRLLVSFENVAVNKFLFHRKRKYLSTAAVFAMIQLYFLLISAFRGNSLEIDACDFYHLYKDGNYTVAVFLLNLIYCGLYVLVLLSYVCAMCFINSHFQKIIPGQTVTNVTLIRLRQVREQNGGQTVTQHSETQAEHFYRRPRDILRMRAMTTLGILLLFLTILNLPFIVVRILRSFDFNVPTPILYLTVIALYIGCSVNPVLYTWRFQELRAELKRMFRLKINNTMV